jgi:hexosaminidase
MKRFWVFPFLFAGIFAQDSNGVIIPQPVKFERKSGSFLLGAKTVIAYHFANKDVKPVAEYLAGKLRKATGFKLPLANATKLPKRDFIFLNFTRDEELGAEGYTIEIDSNKVLLEPNNTTGFFYAVQSFLQLLPPQIYADSVQKVSWTLPACSVWDKPRFSWRGMHLDVSRHFFPTSFIKTYIDMLAMHKFNTFHWHLTDDQGWRVEIKKYPKLTQVSAWRVDHEFQHWNFRTPQADSEQATYGGFYTQKEIKEVVGYASERNITIVPEIEMPAHTTALLAAYPQFSCTGGPFKVPPGGVWPITDIFCAGNDSTFLLIQDILTEVMELFPGKFIHIGGDEADKMNWRKCPKCQARIQSEGLKDETELQSYFVRRIEKFIVSKGRKLVGWDEILEGGLAPEAVVMSWRGEEGGKAAARAGHDAVMTPGNWCYFDHYQGPEAMEPLAIGGYTPLSEVYSYQPVPDSLTSEEAKHILGAQANVWTEYIPTPEHAQYMTLPRMAAMAEVVWSPKDLRNWKSFGARIGLQMKRYEVAHYNVAQSAYLALMKSAVDTMTKRISIAMTTEMPGSVIRFSLDGTDPTAQSPAYDQPLLIEKTSTVRAATFNNGSMASKVSEQKVFFHKGMLKPVALANASERYDGGGIYALTNGMRGTKSFNDGNWIGFHQLDLEATIDFEKIVPVNKMRIGFLQNTASWIFFPSTVEISISEDGKKFVVMDTQNIPVATQNEEPSIREIISNLGSAARFVRVRAKNIGVCPEWHIAKGDKAWLFVDEIVVE